MKRESFSIISFRLFSFRRKTVPALLAGLGLALSIPPWGFWILAFPSAALLWWVLGQNPRAQNPRAQNAGGRNPGGSTPRNRHRLRSRLWIGWVAGVGLFGPGLYWASTFNVYGGIILVIVEALALAIACGVSGTGPGRIVALPSAMILVEWIRDMWPFGGLPIGGIALGQVTGPLGTAARIGGPLLLTGLVWLGGAGIGSLVAAAARTVDLTTLSRRFPAGWRKLVEHHDLPVGPSDLAPVRRRRQLSLSRQPKMAPAIAGIVAIAAVAVVGVLGGVAADGGPPIRMIKVAAVQGGGVRGMRKAQVNPTDVYNAQVEATKRLDGVAGFGGAKTHESALVVWPEDVVSVLGTLAGKPVEQSLAKIARGLHATLLVGVTETVSAVAFRNEVVSFAPTGAVTGTYEKVHRVPFGEFVPFRGFFSHLASLSSVPQDAIPGHLPGFLTTPAGPVGLMISYEVFYADAGRSATRAGAQILIVPTNTSSYSTSQVPTQEVAADRLQAIEEGRDLVQAAPTGYSSVVDNQGHVLQRSVLGAQQVLVASVPLRSGVTIYERYGDLPILLLAVIGLLFGWALNLTELTESDRTRGAALARANWMRLRSGKAGPEARSENERVKR